jgi:hypothetical protein
VHGSRTRISVLSVRPSGPLLVLVNDRQRVLPNNRIRCRPNSWSLPNIWHIFQRISDIFAKNRILLCGFLPVCLLKMCGQTESRDFREILAQRACKAENRLKIVHTNGPKPTSKNKFFCRKPTIIRLSLPNIRLPNIRRAIIWPNIRPTG